jgi:DNA-binding Lrp family transcriptional regulator
MHLCKTEKMVLTRSEKERRIIEMYEAGHTIREIAREVHMSFGPIGNIIRKVTGDSGIDSNNKPIMSKETDALKLFQEAKTPVEAAIILDISSDDTEDLYLGFLRLKNLHRLVLLYKELKYQLPSFFKLYKILRSAGIREEDAADLIKDAKQVPFLRNTFWDLTNANTNLEEQRNGKISELTNIQNEVERHKTYLKIGQHELNRINFEIMEKNRELQDLDRLIDDKTKEYIRYK